MENQLVSNIAETATLTLLKANSVMIRTSELMMDAIRTVKLRKDGKTTLLVIKWSQYAGMERSEEMKSVMTGYFLLSVVLIVKLLTLGMRRIKPIRPLARLMEVMG